MSVSVNSLFTGIAPVALGGIFVIAISMIPIAIDTAKSNWRKRFRQQIKLAVQKGNLSFSDLEHIAERWFQNRNSVLQSLRVLLSEAVSGEDEDLSKCCTEVRDLLDQHQSREPYAELPENISLQLSRIRETRPELSTAVTQLASSLSDLYSTNQRELQKQKKFSYWGFIIGIIGLLLSAPSLYLTFFKP